MNVKKKRMKNKSHPFYFNPFAKNGLSFKLSIILLNSTHLFKNSLESKRKGDLVVNVKIKEDNNNCIISMKDNGNGMSKETLEKIYNDFFTTKETGTGIGIPYIKEIIELHHGTLTYKSRENRGTTVLITLQKKKEKKS